MSTTTTIHKGPLHDEHGQVKCKGNHGRVCLARGCRKPFTLSTATDELHFCSQECENAYYAPSLASFPRKKRRDYANGKRTQSI
jgi:hypothetical protein